MHFSFAIAPLHVACLCAWNVCRLPPLPFVLFREDTDASIMEGEYEWVREYLYDVRQDEEKRTYILRETPTYMGYVDLNTRLMVHKRGKRMKSDSVMAQEFPRPSQVCT